MDYYSKSIKERYEMALKPMFFINQCSFNNKKCSSLKSVANFRYGSCIVFNKQKQGKKNLQISQTGQGTGLIFLLHLHHRNYHESDTTFGVKVIIHHPMVNPNTEEDGFIVSPGFETSISLRQTIYRRLPKPYKDHCVNYGAGTNSLATNKNECIRKCIQARNFETCGCIDQSLGVMDNLRHCNFTDIVESCCIDAVLKNMSHHSSSCSCPLPCSSVYYNEIVSKALLLGTNGSYYLEQYSNPEIIKFSIVRLNIFYSTLERYIYEQKPQWQETEIISYIGNELGLWLGLSLVVIFEVFEILMLVLKCIIAKLFSVLKNTTWCRNFKW
ncbi:Degenerin mec-4 like protein [Argiope bruennichi]|uniref:Degenerin mec-4 like protein n=1 Tax=Argiope bruennichi TaxID=94029 RepID=A0A8T0E9X3_ARGBR|nr:Degenerin mec-4 like protein [Argiope bruennichi]